MAPYALNPGAGREKELEIVSAPLKNQAGEQVALVTNSMQIKAVRESTVVATNILTRQERIIDGVDTVVLALGSVANNRLYEALKGKVPELYLVGQALAPRKMLDSTLDGLRVARMV